MLHRVCLPMYQSSSVAGRVPAGSTVQWNVVMRCQHIIYLIDISMPTLLIAFHTSFNMDISYLFVVIFEVTHPGLFTIKWRGILSP